MCLNYSAYSGCANLLQVYSYGAGKSIAAVSCWNWTHRPSLLLTGSWRVVCGLRCFGSIWHARMATLQHRDIAGLPACKPSSGHGQLCGLQPLPLDCNTDLGGRRPAQSRKQLWRRHGSWHDAGADHCVPSTARIVPRVGVLLSPRETHRPASLHRLVRQKLRNLCHSK